MFGEMYLSKDQGGQGFVAATPARQATAKDMAEYQYKMFLNSETVAGDVYDPRRKTATEARTASTPFMGGSTAANDRPRCSLPDSDALRSQLPMADGLLDYFPNALAEIARHSKAAGDKHHPGEPLHWERGKSTDHRNKILKHLIDTGKLDSEGNRHSTALAWRALALLQEELEKEQGWPRPRNAVGG